MEDLQAISSLEQLESYERGRLAKDGMTKGFPEEGTCQAGMVGRNACGEVACGEVACGEVFIEP
jgi:hypothetical protein